MNRSMLVVSFTVLGVAIVACGGHPSVDDPSRGASAETAPSSPAAPPAQRGARSTTVPAATADTASARKQALPFSSPAVFETLPAEVREQAIAEVDALVAKHGAAFDKPKSDPTSPAFVVEFNALGAEQVTYLQEVAKLHDRYGVLGRPLGDVLAGIGFTPLETREACTENQVEVCGACYNTHLEGATVTTCDGTQWITSIHNFQYEALTGCSAPDACKVNIVRTYNEWRDIQSFGCGGYVCRAGYGDNEPVYAVATSAASYSGTETTSTQCCWDGKELLEDVKYVSWGDDIIGHADCTHDWVWGDYYETVYTYPSKCLGY